MVQGAEDLRTSQQLSRRGQDPLLRRVEPGIKLIIAHPAKALTTLPQYTNRKSNLLLPSFSLASLSA